MNTDDIKPGYKFNSLTVLERVENTNRFRVRCECGNIIELSACRIVNCQRKTCGYCIRKYNRGLTSRDKTRQKIQDIVKSLAEIL